MGTGVMLLWVALQAQAATPGLTLTWVAPPECPTGAQLEGAVARMLGDPADAPPVEVSGTVSREGELWRVQLENAGGGKRTLTGESCRAVSAAAAVVVALMIDPFAQTAAPALLEDPAPRAPLSLGLAAQADTSSLPQLTPGVAVWAGLGVGAGFHLELSAQGWLRQSTLDSPGATLTLFTGGLGARRDFAFGPLILAPLITVEAGALRATSFGVSNPQANFAFWCAARAGLSFAVVLGPVRVGLRAEASVPLTRPRFVVGGVGELYTPALISGRGALTFELLFPPRAIGGGGN